MKKKNVIILGAAGRDFHDFNTYFRDNEEYDVKAFTATQIPDIVGRTYPPVLAGKLYPNGVPIKDEKELPNLIKELDIDVTGKKDKSITNNIMELVSRRPVTSRDISKSLRININEVIKCLKRLLDQEKIKFKVHNNEKFYYL